MMHTAKELFLALFSHSYKIKRGVERGGGLGLGLGSELGMRLILLHAEERAETIDYDTIEAMNLLSPELLAFLNADDADQEALPAPSKQPKLEPLCDATN